MDFARLSASHSGAAVHRPSVLTWTQMGHRRENIFLKVAGGFDHKSASRGMTTTDFGICVNRHTL
jgi:hypothetical protein